MAWVLGAQLVGHLQREHPELRWTAARFPVRTLVDGEASASFRSFDDGSHLVLVSRALQENLICLANVLTYFDVSTAVSRLTLRRRKREREMRESTSRVTAILRYLLLGQRMTGSAPAAPARFDDRSADIARTMAAGAVRFVIAHEIAHIVHGHQTVPLEPEAPDGPVTVSQMQELQADGWAFNFIKEVTADDPAASDTALWSAFIALFAMHVTERALYVRPNRTHPEAWARWATLERIFPSGDHRTELLQLAFMSAIMGASKLDEPFPQDLWPLLWGDSMVTVQPEVTPDLLTTWDRLHTVPVDELAVEARRDATSEGGLLLDALEQGDLSRALARVVPKERRRRQLLDPGAALGFSTLREVFAHPPFPLTTGDEAAFALVAARLAGRHLTVGGQGG
jgi:hypothetical protein